MIKMDKKETKKDKVEEKVDILKTEETKTIKPNEITEEEIKKEEKEGKIEVPKGEEEIVKEKVKSTINVDAWKPKTELGKKIKSGEITSLDYIFDNGLKIKEGEIVDILMPDLESELLLIGQSKGKFGGGKRRIFKQTQKKSMEGNKPKFATLAVVGNGKGIIGIGYGKSKETVPAREKALRNAKLNIFRIKMGSGSWEDAKAGQHSIPFAVDGKCGSVKVKIMPAPKGTGLRIEDECAKILKLAGVNDIWSKTIGQTKTKLNHIYAFVEALKKLAKTKLRADDAKNVGIIIEE